MGASKGSAIAVVAPPEPEEDWDSLRNPAVKALLDHVAGELAQQYVRLMENAGKAGEAETPDSEDRDKEV